MLLGVVGCCYVGSSSEVDEGRLVGGVKQLGLLKCCREKIARAAARPPDKKSGFKTQKQYCTIPFVHAVFLYYQSTNTQPTCSGEL